MGDKKRGRAWVISIDMGYGHDRAAYPLKDIAYKKGITANNYRIIGRKEQAFWYRARRFYEWVSRLKQIPIIGKFVFGIYDKLQTISPFFPFRDLSKPNLGVIYLEGKIKRGFGKGLIDYIKKEKLPVISTHWFPAMAAYYNGVENIYCVITDTDCHRIWVPSLPKESTIKYLAPCEHIVTRLKEYGIPEEKIILTGFPLPKENIGGKSKGTLKRDLAIRLKILDPKNKFLSRYPNDIKVELGKYYNAKQKRPLTITYIVGGAGAEKEIGIKILRSLKDKIKRKEVILNLVAGTRLDVLSYFTDGVKKEKMDGLIGRGVNITYCLGRNYYFKKINEILRNTDILWTKPSELSFYTALGMPIIIAPPVGAHEVFNKQWLEHIGSGILQENPDYVKDWLFYWVDKGRFAEAAWEGFTEAQNMGTYHIEELIK